MDVAAHPANRPAKRMAQKGTLDCAGSFQQLVPVGNQGAGKLADRIRFHQHRTVLKNGAILEDSIDQMSLSGPGGLPETCHARNETAKNTAEPETTSKMNRSVPGDSSAFAMQSVAAMAPAAAVGRHKAAR